MSHYIIDLIKQESNIMLRFILNLINQLDSLKII